jgi:hypothetical protein
MRRYELSLQAIPRESRAVWEPSWRFQPCESQPSQSQPSGCNSGLKHFVTSGWVGRQIQNFFDKEMKFNTLLALGCVWTVGCDKLSPKVKPRFSSCAFSTLQVVFKKEN